MNNVISGMEYVYKPTLLLAEVSLAIFGFMVLFFVIYLLLGKI